MTQEEWSLKSGQKRLEQSREYIMYCSKCRQYGHTLTLVGGDMRQARFFIHDICGGEVMTSRTITHDMFDHLTPQQHDTLLREIEDKIKLLNAIYQNFDATILRAIKRNRRYIRHGLPKCELAPNFQKAEFLSGIAMPRCPKCNSLLVDKIRFRTRLSHFFFRDPPESLQGKTMECLECWHRW